MTSRRNWQPATTVAARGWRQLAHWRVPAVLTAAALCLMAGVTWPILRASWLIVFTRPFSILDGVQALLADGDWVIAAVIIAFSIVFPLAKIVILAVLWIRLRRGLPPLPRLLAAVESFGKWSMLDVFVVALIIFMLKSGSFTTASTAPALYPFIAAVVLTAYGSRMVARDAQCTHNLAR